MTPTETLQKHIDTITLERDHLQRELLTETAKNNIVSFSQGLEILNREIAEHKRTMEKHIRQSAIWRTRQNWHC